MRKAVVAVCALVLGAAGVGLSPATAATRTWQPIGIWKLNEPPGAATARDSSGHHLNAVIGDQVKTGRTAGRHTYVRFPKTDGSGSQGTDRLLVVGDSRRLDPRDRTYRVTVSFRTQANGVNIVQKGQATTPGGYWKMEIYRGRAACLFRGGDGQQSGVRSRARVNDGHWHTVTCTRYSDRAVMRVDGSVAARTSLHSGTIDNSRPLTIGGKSSCGGTVECDYLVGVVDFVRITHA